MANRLAVRNTEPSGHLTLADERKPGLHHTQGESAAEPLAVHSSLHMFDFTLSRRHRATGVPVPAHAVNVHSREHAVVARHQLRLDLSEVTLAVWALTADAVIAAFLPLN